MEIIISTLFCLYDFLVYLKYFKTTLKWPMFSLQEDAI